MADVFPVRAGAPIIVFGTNGLSSRSGKTDIIIKNGKHLHAERSQLIENGRSGAVCYEML